MAGSSPPGWYENKYQKITTFALKKTSVHTVTARVPKRATTRLYAGTKSDNASGTAA